MCVDWNLHLYPFTYQWTLRLLPLLAILNNAIVNVELHPHLFFFFLLAASTACGSSWAKDPTFTTAVTLAVAVITPDP